MRDAERLARPLELAEADARDLGLVVTLLSRLDPARCVAELAVRARDDHGLQPSSEYRARMPPVLDDSSSGCACTAISVSGVLIRQACHDAIGAPIETGAILRPHVRHFDRSYERRRMSA